jgi:hypothetical protein
LYQIVQVLYQIRTKCTFLAFFYLHLSQSVLEYICKQNYIMTSEKQAQESLELLKSRGDALLAEKKQINERWLSKSEFGYDSDSLGAWRKSLLQNEKDLADVSARIQTLFEIFPSIR